MKTSSQLLSLLLGLTVYLTPSALAERDDNQAPKRPMEDFRRGGPGGPNGQRGDRGKGPRPHHGPKLDGHLMKRIHNAADKNNDGMLDAEEKEEFERLVGEAKRRMHKEILARFDKDGDGKLSEEERTKARAAGREKINKLRKEAIKRFDKDGDGELNEEERKEAREAVRQRMMDRAKKFDTNGDGKLDDDERATAREAMAKERGPNAQPPRRGRGPDNKTRPNRPDKPSQPDTAPQHDNPPRQEGGPNREEMRKRFDTNQDGKLDDSERQSMREILRKKRAKNAE